MIDCSTDNSKNIFKNLLDTDPRIRVFTHLKNLGTWRSRLDGFLYSHDSVFLISLKLLLLFKSKIYYSF